MLALAGPFARLSCPALLSMRLYQTGSSRCPLLLLFRRKGVLVGDVFIQVIEVLFRLLVFIADKNFYLLARYGVAPG